MGALPNPDQVYNPHGSTLGLTVRMARTGVTIYRENGLQRSDRRHDSPKTIVVGMDNRSARHTDQSGRI